MLDYFRIFIFQGRTQRNLCYRCQILFFIDKEITLQPVNTVKMFVLLVKGDLVLDVDENHNGSCHSDGEPQQI